MAIRRSRLRVLTCAVGASCCCVLLLASALPTPPSLAFVGPFVTPSSRANARSARRAALDHEDSLSSPSPNPDLDAHAVVTLCMQSLLQGKDGSGLDVCFAFSSDRCRVRAITGTMIPRKCTRDRFSFPLSHFGSLSVCSLPFGAASTAT
jgi:hypothetical protein